MEFDKCVRCALSEPHCRPYILWCSKYKKSHMDVKCKPGDFKRKVSID